MKWSHVVGLISVRAGNENGFPGGSTEGEPRNVFANKKSVRSNEYWEAKNAGVQLQLMFDVRTAEYNGEERLMFDDEKYTIERTYENRETIELVCRKLDDDASRL